MKYAHYLMLFSSLIAMANANADDGNIFTDIGDGIVTGAETVIDASSSMAKYVGEELKELDSNLDREGITLGVSLLGRKIDDEHEVDAAIVVNYEGYGFNFDEYDIKLIPTKVDVTVNGKRVLVFTDAATLEFWGDDFEVAINAFSYDLEKNEGFRVERTEDMTALEITGVKYFTPNDLNENWRAGGIDFEVFGNLGLGGRTEILAIKNNEEIDYSGSKYFSADVGIGANITLTSDLPGEDVLGSDADFYLYAGARYSRSEDLEHTRTYIGLELYTGKSSSGWTVTPYADLFWDDFSFSGPGADQNVDGYGAEVGVKVFYAK